VWHASVAYLDQGKQKTIPVSRLSEMNREILKRVAKSVLSNVGQIPSAVEQFELAIHYRRSLSVEEVAQLTMDWCSIPAIDEGGNGMILERDT